MKSKDNYIFPKKSDLIQLEISAFDSELPDLKNAEDAKSIVIGKWLAQRISKSLENGKICVNNILPSKSEFAYLLGVSIGTVQNAIRYIEDLGYVESKQCIGTLVKNYKNKSVTIRKLTSKRDLAVEAIKRYILTDGFKVGSQLPSSRTIATIIDFSANTTSLALEYLASQYIICRRYKNPKVCTWVVMTLDFDVESSVRKNSETLVDMLVKDMEDYINANLKIGDKMPSHSVLAQTLKASIKSVHDALKVLIDKGILLARRGRYGTTVVKMPNGSMQTLQKMETSIFAPAKDTAFYHYEKTQNYIKRMIAQDYEIGDKLPSIMELSQMLDLSPNTIRKAFQNLAKEGYLVFSRGRYGGTFVIDIPEIESQTFKWIAVNPQYAKEYQNVEEN